VLLEDGGNVRLTRRTTTGGSAATSGSTSQTWAPNWVRLVRTGSTFSGFVSDDGAAWTLVSLQTISMTSTVYVGLATASRTANQLTVATFDHVSVLTSVPEIVRGDFNRDGTLSATDILPMLRALTDLGAYRINKSLTPVQLTALGDMNGDLQITNRDIQSLLNAIAAQSGGDSLEVSAAASSAGITSAFEPATIPKVRHPADVGQIPTQIKLWITETTNINLKQSTVASVRSGSHRLQPLRIPEHLSTELQTAIDCDHRIHPRSTFHRLQVLDEVFKRGVDVQLIDLSSAFPNLNLLI
jgi:hypothetical protein